MMKSQPEKVGFFILFVSWAMQFTTPVQIPSSDSKLNLKSKTCTIGSCFADVIGSNLQNNKFTALVNPLGVTYNPESIHSLVTYAISNALPEEDSYIQHADVHLNYNFHSEISALSRLELETLIKIRIEASHQFLKNADWLIITYGTAWVYERIDNEEIVANCHKMAASNFTKQLISQKKIVESFEYMYTQLKAFNQNIKIILSVSPVRHMKDTFQLNSVSKSALLLSCFTLTKQYDNVYYFPAYEIMMDELRDYRFYKPDLLHPSQEAESYIWQKFIDTFLDESAIAFVKDWQKILADLQHKAFHRVSAAHQHFLKKTLSELEKLSNTVDVSKEVAQIKSQII
jgi:hypothetical protein